MSEGSFEAKLTAKRETAAGIYLTVQVQPEDYQAELATLRVGSTMMLGWAEIVNTAVEPIVIPSSPHAAPLIGTHAVAKLNSEPGNHGIAGTAAKDRRPFASLPLSQQAGIRCGDAIFQEFVSCRTNSVTGGPEAAAGFVRNRCGITSRGQLDHPQMSSARFSWTAIESEYQSWLTDRQYAGAVR